MKRITISIPEQLHEQLETIQSQSGESSLSGLASQLVRLGVAVYCEQESKFLVMQKLRRGNN